MRQLAGQTVMHLHLHVIPRYRGDMDDPRGGVRHAIPSRREYHHRPDRVESAGLVGSDLASLAERERKVLGSHDPR